MYVFLNNQYLPESKAKISALDSGFLYGKGVYETLRTYNGEIFNIENHFKRLKTSAEIINLKISFKPKQLKNWIYTLMKKNKIKEARIRLTLTPGIQKFDESKIKKTTVLIQTEKLQKIPQSLLEKGIDVITYKTDRILPEAKTTCLLPQILARGEMNKKKAYEVLLINIEGFVTEGSITNYFIIKNKILYTPEENILKGTMRAKILKKAKQLLKVKTKNIKLEEIYKADECFVSNAPRGILAVVKVNNKKIDRGLPGVYTKKLISLFQQTT